MQKVLVIVGPTASGKSALAVELAHTFKGEVISADSRQVYKGLDIGTGKITKKEMRGVPHHLLDVVSPKKTFTAHDYLTLAKKKISMIYHTEKLPIICGGTGFYIDALLGRITLPDVPANNKLRGQLEKKNAAELFALLKKNDPARAKSIDPHNTRRLIRALEIATALGKNPKPKSKSEHDVLWIGLKLPMKELERKITIRLFVRIRGGMIVEAKHLRRNGLSWKRMEALGLEYRSLARLLQKKISKKQFEEELYIAIRQYAKRQITYWKHNTEIKWMSPRDKIKIKSLIRRWLQKRWTIQCVMRDSKYSLV